MTNDKQISSADFARNSNESLIADFNTVYGRHYQSLCLFASRITGDMHAAQDIATDVLLTLWLDKRRFRSPLQIKTFLYRSARNACLNHLKKRKNEEKQQAVFRQIHAANDDHILRSIIRTEVLAELNALMGRLPAACRQIIYLHFIKGLSHQEIANLLGISVHTVRNQVVIGIGKMRERSYLLIN